MKLSLFVAAPLLVSTPVLKHHMYTLLKQNISLVDNLSPTINYQKSQKNVYKNINIVFRNYLHMCLCIHGMGSNTEPIHVQPLYTYLQTVYTYVQLLYTYI